MTLPVTRSNITEGNVTLTKGPLVFGPTFPLVFPTKGIFPTIVGKRRLTFMG